MRVPQRHCTECGELISLQRLEALPDTQRCFECAVQTSASAQAVPPPKPIAAKTAATTFHLKRYLSNVGQKTDDRALSRMLVRINYLFLDISTAEMIPVLIKWNRETNSGFDQEQIRERVLATRKWVLEHPSKKS
jgi:hypothetical protein